MEQLIQIINYLGSPEIRLRFLWLQIIFWILTIYFIFGIFYFGRKGQYFYDRRRRSRFWRDYKVEFTASQKHEKKWARIEKYLKSDLTSDYKKAVVEAGILLNNVLEAAGSGKGNFEEKVNKVMPKPSFDIEKLFETHRLYLKIVDNPEISINLSQAKEAISSYQKALVELKYF